jgi:glycosyltransferase involved in cell wall biosynthesis
MARPFVSVLTPTYNRRTFLPGLLKCYTSQTYPQDRMEWIVLDDGDDSVKDVFDEASKTIPNIRYIRHETKLLIGAKRNILNKEAKGDILVAMDDDDFYPPERVAHCVYKLNSHPKVELAGSSEIYMYFTDDKSIYRFGPYFERHATNGTMAWRKSYAKTHTYDETVTHAEERSFLEDYKHPMVQLDPFKTMLVIAHAKNTFDKKKLRDDRRDDPKELVKKTQMKIKDFIKKADMRKYYETA